MHDAWMCPLFTRSAALTDMYTYWLALESIRLNLASLTHQNPLLFLSLPLYLPLSMQPQTRDIRYSNAGCSLCSGIRHRHKPNNCIEPPFTLTSCQLHFAYHCNHQLITIIIVLVWFVNIQVSLSFRGAFSFATSTEEWTRRCTHTTQQKKNRMQSAIK